MRRRLLAFAALLLSASLAPAAAAPERRVALVIGNAAYATLPQLPGADDDAAAIASALTRVGFSVTRAINADRRAMLDAVATFRRDAATADAALLFYSGLALRYRDTTYLAPVDAALRDEAGLAKDAVALSQAIEALPAAGASFVVIDGCGSSRLAPALARFGALAAPGPGAPPTRANMFVALSADGQGPACATGTRSSLLSRWLAAEIGQPGLSARDLFERVRAFTARRSGGQQTVLLAGLAPLGFTFSLASAADSDFRGLGAAPSASELRAFVARHPDDPLAQAAAAMAPMAAASRPSDGDWRRERRDKARAARFAALDGRWNREESDRAAERAAAETRRRAEIAAAEQRRLEQQRSERERADLEEKARLVRQQEEERRISRERAEAERTENDARIRFLREQEERRRQGDAARDKRSDAPPADPAASTAVAGQAVDEANRFTAEQRRLAQERIEREQRARGKPAEFSAPLPSESGGQVVASLPPSDAGPAKEAPATPVPRAGTPDFIKATQEQLKRLGCYAGSIQPRFTDGVKAALAQAAGKIGPAFTPDPLNEDGLRQLAAQPAGLCAPAACGPGQTRRGDICVASRPRRPERSGEAAPARPHQPQQRRVARPAEAPAAGGGRGGCFSFGGRQYCQ